MTGACARCSEPLSGKRRLWCSACAAEVNRQRTRAKVVKVAEPARGKGWSRVEFPDCPHCRKPFTRRFGVGHRRKKFCSKGCADAAQTHEPTSHRIKRRARNAIRNKERRRLIVIQIDPMEVFERDEWTCQLCGIATPRELRGTHAHNAPELDHRVPLSRGGVHDWDNVRCLCRSCNGFKGIRTDDEVHAALAA